MSVFASSFISTIQAALYYLSKKGVLTAQDYGVAVVGSWQISQQPLTVYKGEWGDRLLSRVYNGSMLGALTLSH